MKRLICLILIACLSNSVRTLENKCKSPPVGPNLICYVDKISVNNFDVCSCTHVILTSDNVVEKNIQELKNKNPYVKVVIRKDLADKENLNIPKSFDGIELILNEDYFPNSKSDLSKTIEVLKSDVLAEKSLVLLALPTNPQQLAKNFDFKALEKLVDIFILQSDNLRSSKKNIVYHPSRLSGLWDMLNADSVVDLTIGLGVDKSRLAITAPLRVLEFTLTNSSETLPGSPAESEPNVLSQRDLCELFDKKEKWVVERDEDQAGSYAFRKNKWIAFEDPTSLQIKSKYIRIRGLNGLALSDIELDAPCGDSPSLLVAANQAMRSQTRAPRGALLHSLERDIYNSPVTRFVDAVQLSPYRITRVVDEEGHIHAIREDTRTEFTCSRQGFFVHPKSCGKFYRCVKFDQLSDEWSVFEFSCPSGLVFDSKWEVCVWPGQSSHACPGSSEITPVPRERFICPPTQGYYADPENCRWFFACLDHGKDPMSAYEFRCPFGLVFDEARIVCEWPWKVAGQCGSNGFVYEETYYSGTRESTIPLQFHSVSHEAEAYSAGGSVPVPSSYISPYTVKQVQHANVEYHSGVPQHEELVTLNHGAVSTDNGFVSHGRELHLQNQYVAGGDHVQYEAQHVELPKVEIQKSVEITPAVHSTHFYNNAENAQHFDTHLYNNAENAQRYSTHLYNNAENAQHYSTHLYNNAENAQHILTGNVQKYASVPLVQTQSVKTAYNIYDTAPQYATGYSYNDNLINNVGRSVYYNPLLHANKNYESYSVGNLQYNRHNFDQDNHVAFKNHVKTLPAAVSYRNILHHNNENQYNKINYVQQYNAVPQTHYKLEQPVHTIGTYQNNGHHATSYSKVYHGKSNLDQVVQQPYNYASYYQQPIYYSSNIPANNYVQASSVKQFPVVKQNLHSYSTVSHVSQPAVKIQEHVVPLTHNYENIQVNSHQQQYVPNNYHVPVVNVHQKSVELTGPQVHISTPKVVETYHVTTPAPSHDVYVESHVHEIPQQPNVALYHSEYNLKPKLQQVKQYVAPAVQYEQQVYVSSPKPAVVDNSHLNLQYEIQAEKNHAEHELVESYNIHVSTPSPQIVQHIEHNQQYEYSTPKTTNDAVVIENYESRPVQYEQQTIVSSTVKPEVNHVYYDNSNSYDHNINVEVSQNGYNGNVYKPAFDLNSYQFTTTTVAPEVVVPLQPIKTQKIIKYSQPIVYNQPQVKSYISHQPSVIVESSTPKAVEYSQPIVYSQPQVKSYVSHQPSVIVESSTPKAVEYSQPIVYSQPQVKSYVSHHHQPSVIVESSTPKAVEYSQPIVYSEPQVKSYVSHHHQPSVIVESSTPKAVEYSQPIVYSQPQVKSYISHQPSVIIESSTPKAVEYSQPIVYSQPQVKSYVSHHYQPSVIVESSTPKAVEYSQPIVYSEPQVKSYVSHHHQPSVIVESSTPKAVEYSQPIVYSQPQVKSYVSHHSTPNYESVYYEPAKTQKVVEYSQPIVYKQTPVKTVTAAPVVVESSTPKSLLGVSISSPSYVKQVNWGPGFIERVTPAEYIETATSHPLIDINNAAISTTPCAPIIEDYDQSYDQYSVQPQVSVQKNPILDYSFGYDVSPVVQNTKKVLNVTPKPILRYEYIAPAVSTTEKTFVQPEIQSEEIVVTSEPNVEYNSGIYGQKIEYQSPVEYNSDIYTPVKNIDYQNVQVNLPHAPVQSTTAKYEPEYVYDAVEELDIDITPKPIRKYRIKTAPRLQIVVPDSVVSTTPKTVVYQPNEEYVISSTLPPDDTVFIKTKLSKNKLFEKYTGDKENVKSATIIANEIEQPYLVTKLGAQCECVSNNLSLRRNPIVITTPKPSFKTVTTPADIFYNPSTHNENIDVSISSPSVVQEINWGQGFVEKITPAEFFIKTIQPAQPTYTTVSYEPNVEISSTPLPSIVVPEVYTRRLRPTVAPITVTEAPLRVLPRVSVSTPGTIGISHTTPVPISSTTPLEVIVPEEPLVQTALKCTRPGLFRHPHECNKFYSCNWDCNKKRYTLHVFNCPVRLSFDEGQSACNWPSHGPSCQHNTLLL